MGSNSSKGSTYFIRKIHLQDVPELMAPPKTGPKSMAKPRTREVPAVYVAYFDGGTSSKNMTMTSE
jgi:hypothetical protein